MLEAVLDASTAAAFALFDEDLHAAADTCLATLQERSVRLIAPPLWESEFDGILRRRVFTGKSTSQNAVAALRVVDALKIEIIYDARTRVLARSIAESLNQMRVYDATYAALAQLRGCDFWTADERFYNAASSISPFVRFVGSATT